MSEDEMPVRSCGGCTACCYTHAVGELDKWELTACASCTADGCAIYASRPRSCGSFFCTWIVSEIGNEDERPDKVGVVCSVLYGRYTSEDPPSVLMLEAWPGAFEEAPAQMFLTRVLAGGTSARVRTHGEILEYHVLKGSMDAYGRRLEESGCKVVWHEPIG